MNLPELIKSRRSIKLFKPEPVSQEFIIELLETAVFAPNHRFTEPWRFILLSNEAKLQYAQLRAEDARSRGKDYGNAKAAIKDVPGILVVTSSASQNALLERENYLATACVIQNFLLLAWDKGLGTALKTFPDTPELREFLGLKDAHVAAVIYYGYPAELPPARKRREVAELVRIL